MATTARLVIALRRPLAYPYRQPVPTHQAHRLVERPCQV